MALSTNICVYKHCVNNIKEKKCSFFRFPSDINRVKQWQKLCGNMTLALMDPESLNKYRICEKHFLVNDIINYATRKVLKKSSNPIPYQEESGK